ncbi:aspartyl/asparaginyl beta-hydroxylase domain-containing protein [Nitrospirillum iridis]|uniref:Aspartyl/asparaginyl beta-hydroxylase (Cupin superfamily) n=1 Tax=Nitrospirillum iridis TaxID=765888 RepID=A0A7X0EBZ1_9PROT|nr:aspartyl/asparaginyl beta-hydroxylase domain-containing protein [Nitrospirillum iridis]MBB6250590.1 aspartyl/asparaginyl beta-hydroxylase (cupin superfamily) [Nitrospirillum iridis]
MGEKAEAGTAKPEADDQARSLNTAAVRAMAAGQPARAHALLEEALSIAPNQVPLWLNLAGARRALGDPAAALAALDSALGIDPRNFMALLMRASLLDGMGEARQAGAAYGTALSLAPPDGALDAPTARAVARARERHSQYLADLDAFLKGEIDGDLSRCRSGEARRMARFVDGALGRAKPYHQQPAQFFYPGLPALEFHDPEDFPWLMDLEAGTDVVRAELAAVLTDEDDPERFVPYIAYPDGLPLDQWSELNHSPRWSAFHFMHYGRPHRENRERCPRTAALLDAMPQPQVPGKSPAAMFSVLKPRTRIPAHTGVSNTRLVVHLPLVVPAGCGFRVGNETREWQVGKAWVFDDTIEHEAWNDSDQTRVILLFDIWHPHLSVAEREMITRVMTGIDRFNGDAAPAGTAGSGL